nr:MBL fold metallo-hydrolase [Chloroflexota bacterium]
MGLRVLSIGSGSCGNAVVVSTKATTLLIDCGVGRAEIELGLAAIGRSLLDVEAILVSHEHHDHIRGLSRLGRAIPVICTRGTGRATRLLRGVWEEMRPNTSRRIGELEVMMLPVFHDAAEPCGYSISDGANRVTILTDLGCWSDELAAPIAESSLIMLEANHDERMLH